MTKESKTEDHASPVEIGDRTSLKGFSWNISAAVAALTAFTFAAAATGEWAYYHRLGALDFLSLASPADYISGALLWVPKALLTLVAGYVLLWTRFLLTEGPRKPTDEEIAQRPRRLKGFWGITLFIVILFLMGLTIYVMTEYVMTDGKSASIWIIPGMTCWMVFIVWFSTHPLTRAYGPSSEWLALLIAGPMLVAFIFVNGHDKAVTDLMLPRGEYRIVHSTGEVEDDVQLLRATSVGVLVLRVSTRDVSFLTYGSFNRIDQIGSSK